MNIVAKRLRSLRESIGISQEKLAKELDATQSSINRYENAQTSIPLPLLRRYADFFDVSLDYIFGRTDHPEGKLYGFKPLFKPENEELRRFVEMCFEPGSPMQSKLKETLIQMMEGSDDTD